MGLSPREFFTISCQQGESRTLFPELAGQNEAETSRPSRNDDDPPGVAKAMRSHQEPLSMVLHFLFQAKQCGAANLPGHLDVGVVSRWAVGADTVRNPRDGYGGVMFLFTQE